MTVTEKTTSEAELQELGAHLFRNYRRAPVAFERGEGCRLTSTTGKTYIDFLAGIATSSLGHAHPRLVAALQDQVSRYLHVSNIFHIPEQSEAARLLSRATDDKLTRAFFCNSGTEAVEAAIKLARKWGSRNQRSEIVVTDRGFHGRTLGALAATGNPAYHEGFGPLPAGFRFVPFNDLAALQEAVGEQTCAVLLEPVQGEGGVYPATQEFLKGAEQACRDNAALLILDEVQTGIGRTGTMFAYQQYGVEPDVITLAKGLGGGVPVGAVLASAGLATTLRPGDHGSTFGGNPLAMSAVVAVQRALLEDGVLENAAAMSQVLGEELQKLVDEYACVTGVRGLGLLLALQLDESTRAGAVVSRCLELGLILNAVRPDAIRFAPPLVVGRDDVAEAIAILRQALSEQAERGVAD